MIAVPDQQHPQQPTALMTGGRTAHVSAVPRSHKLKISGGTQTTTADFPQSKFWRMQQKEALSDLVLLFCRNSSTHPVQKFLADRPNCRAIIAIGERKVWFGHA
jgi:hypothetical protein